MRRWWPNGRRSWAAECSPRPANGPPEAPRANCGTSSAPRCSTRTAISLNATKSSASTHRRKPDMSLRLQRANFLVSNLERALQFYRDVLGFEVAFVKEPRQTSYSHQVFGIDRSQPVGFATLSTPNQARVMALTEVRDLAPQTEPRRSAIVLEVADINAAVAAPSPRISGVPRRKAADPRRTRGPGGRPARCRRQPQRDLQHSSRRGRGRARSVSPGGPGLVHGHPADRRIRGVLR